MKIFKIMKNKFKPQHIQDASRTGVTTLIHKYLDKVFHWYIRQKRLIQRYTALKKMNLLKIDFQLKNRQ